MVKRGGGRGGANLLRNKLHIPSFPKKAKGKPPQAPTKTSHQNVKYAPSSYEDPTLSIPYSKELCGKERNPENSVLNKILNSSLIELTEFMIGPLAYKKVDECGLSSIFIDHVRDFKRPFKESFEGLKEIGDIMFPAYVENVDIQSQALTEGSVYQFMATVTKKLIPNWMLQQTKGERRHFMERLAKALTSWKDGECLISEYAEVPFSIGYIKKIVKNGLSSLPLQEEADVVNGIAMNITKFLGLLYVHLLRYFVKVGTNSKGILQLFYRKAYSDAKKAGKLQLPAGGYMSEASVSGTDAVNNDRLEAVSDDELLSPSKALEAVSDDDEAEAQPEKTKTLEKKRKRTASNSSNGVKKDEVAQPARKVKRLEKKDQVDAITLSDDADDEPPPPPKFDRKKVKSEYDPRKVKGEKFDSHPAGDQMIHAFAHDTSLPLGAEASKFDTASRTSSTPAYPAFGSAVTDTNDPYLEKMLLELEQDTSLQTAHRHMFSMLVANNRDLRQNNANLTAMNRNQDAIIRQREQKIQEQENTIRMLRQMLEFHNVRPPPGFLMM